MTQKAKFQSIVLMGQAGTGKGIQSAKLAETLGYNVFSVGDKTREYAAMDTPLGRHIASVHLTGWIPEWLASYVMTKAIMEDYYDSGIVFESVARKPEEAYKFHDIHTQIGRSYLVIHMTAPEDILVERLLERKREGYDTLERIEQRFNAFQEETMVSINHFKEQGNVVEVNANQSVEAVYDDILKLVI